VTSVLMPIGSFARLTGLTVKALRHYDEIGLLRPAHVDPQTGYRSYAAGQVRVGLRIAALRALALPLSEIARLLAGDDEGAVLSAHLERVDARAQAELGTAARLRRLIAGEEKTVPEDMLYRIELKEIAAADLIVISGQTSASGLQSWLRAALAELFACGRELASGPPFAAIGAPDEDEMIELEAALPVASNPSLGGRVQARHEDAFWALVALHRGPTAGLAMVHRALSYALADQGIAPVGDPREIYLTAPGELSESGHQLIEVAWPIADRKQWRPNQELFTKRLDPGLLTGPSVARS
jgi:DNA-binding transcriptional MerR regulator